MWVTNNLGYDVELSGVHLYRASQQEITEAQATALLANATYVLLKTNGQLVQSDSQPDANGQYYVRPLDGAITLNGFPSNPNGSPEVSPLEAFDIGKEEGGGTVESSKTVAIASDKYSSPIEVTPSEEFTAMAKVITSITKPLYIGVGSNVQTSKDALFWTTQENSDMSPSIVRAVIDEQGHGVGLLHETANKLRISEDGLTWTELSIDNNRQPNDITYANGVWVIVCENGVVLTSTDRTHWSKQIISDYTLTSVRYADDKWVIVGPSGHIYVSENAVDWIDNDGPSMVPFFVGYFKNNWILLGYTYSSGIEIATIATSSDLNTWQTSILEDYGSLRRVAYSDTYICAVAYNRINSTRCIIYSEDVDIWQETVIGGESVQQLVFIGDALLALRGDSSLISKDFVHWQSLDLSYTNWITSKQQNGVVIPFSMYYAYVNIDKQIVLSEAPLTKDPITGSCGNTYFLAARNNVLQVTYLSNATFEFEDYTAGSIPGGWTIRSEDGNTKLFADKDLRGTLSVSGMLCM